MTPSVFFDIMDKVRDVVSRSVSLDGPVQVDATLRYSSPTDIALKRIEVGINAQEDASQEKGCVVFRPLHTKAEVADILKISTRTLDTLVSEGKIVPVKVRGQRRFTSESVDAYVRSAVEGVASRGAVR